MAVSDQHAVRDLAMFSTLLWTFLAGDDEGVVLDMSDALKHSERGSREIDRLLPVLESGRLSTPRSQSM